MIPVALVAFLVFCGIDLVDIYLEDLSHANDSGTYIQGYGLSFAVLLILGFIPSLLEYLNNFETIF